MLDEGAIWRNRKLIRGLCRLWYSRYIDNSRASPSCVQELGGHYGADKHPFSADIGVGIVKPKPKIGMLLIPYKNRTINVITKYYMNNLKALGVDNSCMLPYNSNWRSIITTQGSAADVPCLAAS